MNTGARSNPRPRYTPYHTIMTGRTPKATPKAPQFPEVDETPARLTFYDGDRQVVLGTERSRDSQATCLLDQGFARRHRRLSSTESENASRAWEPRASGPLTPTLSPAAGER